MTGNLLQADLSESSGAGSRFLTTLLMEQQQLTAVERFSRYHDAAADASRLGAQYAELIPVSAPQAGQQYAFEVDLDSCSGCKACVVACHTLNGLEEEETWRKVGVMTGDSPIGRDDLSGEALFHVTTACHHCLQPGCLEGCPVQAYDKDPVTGIVRHLDDQCIGCKYCTMMCPYEVPQYSAAKGIVRKCDMCRQRLAVGEAPACVQACPNEAIRIRTVETADVRVATATGSLVPKAPASNWTRPTTHFKTAQETFADARPQDWLIDQPAESHWPLAVMLVLTQCSVGLLVAERAMAMGVSAEPSANVQPIALAAAVLLAFVGLNVAPLHLGRPFKAWRVFLGLRTSWLSREAVVLGMYAGLLTGALLLAWSPWVADGLPSAVMAYLPSDWATPIELVALAVGCAGLYASAMIYIATGRPLWRFRRTLFRFAATAIAGGAMVLVPLLLARGVAVTPAALLAAVGCSVALLKGVWEWRTHWGSSRRGLRMEDVESSAALGPAEEWDWRARRLARLRLMPLVRARVGTTGIGIALAIIGIATAIGGRPLSAIVITAVAAMAVIAGELLERLLYFRGVVYHRMPGVIR